MNEALLAAWKETVGEADTIICGGDIALAGALKRQRLARVRAMPERTLLVRGNHDFGRNGRPADTGSDALLPAGAGARSPRFGGHGDACAPGVLAKLRPVRERGGVVLELGCGSGALTRHLVAAGHRVIATDASPAMLALTREAVPGVEAVRRLPCPTTSSRPPTL